MQKFLSFVVNWLLRLGVLLFLFPFLLDFWKNPGSDFSFWIIALRVLYLLIFAAIIVLVVFTNRLAFYNYGFSIVMLGAIYRAVEMGLIYGITTDLTVHFLLIVTSLYFMTKTERRRKPKNDF